MMYVHRYHLGDRMIYVISEGRSRPGTMTITNQAWEGVVSENSGKVKSALKFLESAPWSKKEQDQELEELKRLRLTHIARITAKLDKIADEIQQEDPVIAKAIDQISDYMEGRTTK